MVPETEDGLEEWNLSIYYTLNSIILMNFDKNQRQQRTNDI